MVCEPRRLRRGDCAADSGSNPGLTSRRRGAGCAGVNSVRLWHRAERALGPCRWGAWQPGSGGWERTAGEAEAPAEEEEGADWRAGLVRDNARVGAGLGHGVSGWAEAGLGRAVREHACAGAGVRVWERSCARVEEEERAQ